MIKSSVFMAVASSPSPTESDSSIAIEHAEGVREYLQDQFQIRSSEHPRGQDVQHGGLFNASQGTWPCDYCASPTKSRWCDACHLWWHRNIECPPPVRLRSFSNEVRQGPQGMLPACWSCIPTSWMTSGTRSRSSRQTLH